MDIEKARHLCTDETIVMTQHVSYRCRERGITLEDIKQAIMQGKIIEDYPEDYPYPSCLVLGSSAAGQPIHVVCGVGEGRLWIITAYYPNLDKWDADFRTRKGK